MKSWVLMLAGVLVAAAAVAEDQAAAVAVAAKGMMVTAANGSRLGAVYRVNADGSASLIMDGKLVTIPAATLSSMNGRLMTSLSKNEVADLH